MSTSWPSVLAIVSKAVFEKMHGASIAVGAVLPISRYDSKHAVLSVLAEGGDLYLVTVRPGERLWLVGVLRAPRFTGERWEAAPNTAPVVDITVAIPELRFRTGAGIAAAPGKLGMSLQTPRALAGSDVARLEELLAPGPSRVLRAAALGQDLRTLLDVDDTFAVTSFDAFPKKDYTASGAVVDALDPVTSAGAMLLVAGCMLWVARRLEKVTDVRRCELAAEALLCLQDSPFYFRPTTISEWPPAPEQKTDAERAVWDLSDQLWSVYAVRPGHHPLPPSAFKIAGVVVTMARTVLGARGKKPFEAWLATTLERLRQVAPNPRVLARAELPDKRFDWNVERRFNRENMGPPLPPALLDPRQAPEASTLGPLYAEFLASVDWKDNPFLASPELMKERGFASTPYVPSPGAVYPAGVGRATEVAKAEVTPLVATTPYPFLATLEGKRAAERAKALRAYVTSRGLPAHFGERELVLDHAFSALLGRPVTDAKGLHVGILEASIHVVGDLSILVDDARPRIAALQRFEPVIEVSAIEPVREILVQAVGKARLESRMGERSSDLISVRGGDTRIGSITRAELAKVADDLHDHVTEVRMIAPSDGTLFDALRYMVQQEDEPWGMSNILSTSDMIVERVDGKLEAALEAVENEDLRAELSAFCDAHGRSARAWRWKGKGRKHPGEPTLRFVAGVYDGEGVGFELDVYRVEESP